MPSTVVYRKSIFIVWDACAVKVLFRIIIIYFNWVINVTIYLFLRFCFAEISFHEKYFLISYLRFYIWITFHEKSGIFLKTKLNKMFVIYQIHQFHLLTSCNYYLLSFLNPQSPVPKINLREKNTKLSRIESSSKSSLKKSNLIYLAAEINHWPSIKPNKMFYIFCVSVVPSI